MRRSTITDFAPRPDDVEARRDRSMRLLWIKFTFCDQIGSPPMASAKWKISAEKARAVSGFFYAPP
jgi:hypothetical protein